MTAQNQLPPLSLYIHIPWCVQKCPYCDFNSHAQKGAIPQDLYINALIQDLQHDLARFKLENGVRPLHSIFIGGGTPSLIDPDKIGRLLQEIQACIPFKEDIEITMEANPGSIEAERFAQYQAHGVNRISIGVQSFENEKLQKLGRIHGADEAVKAAKLAHTIGLNSFNLDLMHGLPNQTPEQALNDLGTAISLKPPHLSWYQLTIEPNTLFYSKPPRLPDDDDLWEIFEKGHQKLTEAGYVQYEVSGYSQPGFQCKHNLNYWHFGDYLGIGCGAHGKITSFAYDVNKPEQSGTPMLLDTPHPVIIERTTKVKHPKGYLNLLKDYLDTHHIVAPDELAFEYFMNRFRLLEACPKQEFVTRTGLSLASIDEQMTSLENQGFITQTSTHWQVTQKGRLFFNDLIDVFITEED